MIESFIMLIISLFLLIMCIWVLDHAIHDSKTYFRDNYTYIMIPPYADEPQPIFESIFFADGKNQRLELKLNGIEQKYSVIYTKINENLYSFIGPLDNKMYQITPTDNKQVNIQSADQTVNQNLQKQKIANTDDDIDYQIPIIVPIITK